ncbi:Carbonic anhydrase 2 [Planctomycetes bacterium CA13]|uniref:Carbonic anhydrase n=2 Tax=Novipirellula herctigrandis TaxID=2527986 RepID=A0A5C5ZCZ3_9BACT|nr:Carbonic anhydrase 2 [Planctomycetes bacterium CA13]
MVAAGGLGFTGVPGALNPSHASDLGSALSIKAAIARLKLGNERFVNGEPRHFRSAKRWRDHLVEGQNPFAVVLGCADSRVPIELVFDQGFGDLFVIRNAGNVVMDDVAGSIEYAVKHLHTKLVVVMGHEGCGAVTAAFKNRKERRTEPPELQTVLKLIEPAIAHLNPNEHDAIAKGVEANVLWSVKNMVRLQKERNRAADFSIVGAVYELQSGRVRFLDPSPEVPVR